MKRIKTLMLFFSILLLCSCSRRPVDPPAQTATAFADVYGAMHQTYAAESTRRLPSDTPLPAPTATPTPTDTQAAVIYYPVYEEPTEEPVEATPTIPCYNAAHVKDLSVPDGSVMSPGQAFTKTWSIKNTGSCDWTPLFALDFGSGEIMGATAVPINQTLKPGEVISISVPMIAPAEEGPHTGNWIMRNESWDHFGMVVFVTIVTDLDAGSLTPSN